MTKLKDKDVFGTAPQKKWSDADVFTAPDDILDTTKIGATGFAQGLNESMNPMKLLSGLAALGTLIGKAMPGGQALADAAAPGIRAADEASKSTQPADFVKGMPGFGDLYKLAESVTGAAPRTVAEAYETGNIEKTPTRDAIAAATKFLGSQVPMAAVPGMSLVRAGTGAVGAGVGQYLGGEAGAMAGGMIGTGLPVTRRPPPPAPSTQSYLRQGGAALDDFAATPAAVTPGSFQRYATAVEGQLNPYSRTSNLYGQYPLPPSTYPTAGPLMERMRTWAQGRTQDGRPIHGFTMEDLKAFRDELNTALKGAAHRSPDQRALLIMKDNLDEYLGGLRNRTDALHGNVEEAAGALREGLGLYARGAAARTADEMARRAENRSSSYVLSNADRATRVEFGRAINNPRTLARLEGTSPGVTEALTEAAQGGQLRNIESFVGRYSPHGVIPAAAHMGAILSGKGGVAPILSAVITALARVGAGSRARADAASVSDFIRRGGPAPITSGPNPAFIGAILEALTGSQPSSPTTGTLQ